MYIYIYIFVKQNFEIYSPKSHIGRNISVWSQTEIGFETKLTAMMHKPIKMMRPKKNTKKMRYFQTELATNKYPLDNPYYLHNIQIPSTHVIKNHLHTNFQVRTIYTILPCGALWPTYALATNKP